MMEEKRKNSLYVMIGIPGAGKSTYAEYIKRMYNGYIASSDKMRQQLFGDEADQTSPCLVFKMLDKQIAIHLKYGDVIFDATNYSRKLQRDIIDKWKDKARLIAVYVDPGLSVCKIQNKKRKRVVPDEVLERMHKKLWKPTFEDGWDDIICPGNEVN